MTPLKTLALTTAILAVPAVAMANFAMGDKLGTDEATIRTMLEDQGYQVQEFTIENNEIEVEVLKDGVETEFVLSQSDGTLIEIEQGHD